jgi:hypothetical protein
LSVERAARNEMHKEEKRLEGRIYVVGDLQSPIMKRNKKPSTAVSPSRLHYINKL